MNFGSKALILWLPLFVGSILSPPAISAERLKQIALVSGMSAAGNAANEAAFRERMQELGWVESKNVLIAKRYADGKLDRLSPLILDSLSMKPDVLIAPGTLAALAAKKATRTTPIVSLMGDPVGTGLAESLAHPGGNVTGVSIQTVEEVPAKWLELIREVLPRASMVAVIVNPDNAISQKTVDRIATAEAATRLKHLVLPVRRADQYADAIKEAGRRAQAAIVIPDALSSDNRELIGRAAEKYRVPVLAWTDNFVVAGALMAYGPDERMIWRGVAEYADKILKGANPADLPIQQPTEFQLSFNLRTARALGVSIPESLLQRADKVIR